MNGVFLNPKGKYVFVLFLFLTGTFIAVRFALWGLDAVHAGSASSAMLAFSFAFFGLLVGLSAIVLSGFNRKAFFTLDDNGIHASFGWYSELHTELAAVKSVEARGRELILHFSGKTVCVAGLVNADALRVWILRRRPDLMTPPDAAQAEARLAARKKRCVFLLIMTVLSVLLLFLHIAWIVILTDGKDLEAFSRTDTVLLAVFLAAEILTLALTVFFAARYGKSYTAYLAAEKDRITAAAFTHRIDAPEEYPNVIRVRYFADYSVRFVIFAVEGERFSFAAECFDLPTRRWVRVCGPEDCPVFESLPDLLDALNEEYADEMLID